MKNNSVADELLKLKQLLDDGAITQNEYEIQKKNIIVTNVDLRPELSTEQLQKNIPSPQKKKKRGCGCLVVLILLGAVSIVPIQQALTPGTSFYNDTHPESQNLTPEDWLAFDEKTWSDFITLYKNHNALLSWVEGYSQGTVDSGTLYSKCEEFKDSFRNLSVSYDYGMNSEQNDYLSVFESVALSDQMAAESMLKYMKSGKTNDLDNVSNNIQKAKDSITMIASNRGILLNKAGLTQEQIKTRVNDSMAALEK